MIYITFFKGGVVLILPVHLEIKANEYASQFQSN